MLPFPLTILFFHSTWPFHFTLETLYTLFMTIIHISRQEYITVSVTADVNENNLELCAISLKLDIVCLIGTSTAWTIWYDTLANITLYIIKIVLEYTVSFIWRKFINWFKSRTFRCTVWLKTRQLHQSAQIVKHVLYGQWTVLQIKSFIH